MMKIATPAPTSGGEPRPEEPSTCLSPDGLMKTPHKPGDRRRKSRFFSSPASFLGWSNRILSKTLQVRESETFDEDAQVVERDDHGQVIIRRVETDEEPSSPSSMETLFDHASEWMDRHFLLEPFFQDKDDKRKMTLFADEKIDLDQKDSLHHVGARLPVVKSETATAESTEGSPKKRHSSLRPSQVVMDGTATFVESTAAKPIKKPSQWRRSQATGLPIEETPQKKSSIWRRSQVFKASDLPIEGTPKKTLSSLRCPQVVKGKTPVAAATALSIEGTPKKTPSSVRCDTPRPRSLRQSSSISLDRNNGGVETLGKSSKKANLNSLEHRQFFYGGCPGDNFSTHSSILGATVSTQTQPKPSPVWGRGKLFDILPMSPARLSSPARMALAKFKKNNSPTAVPPSFVSSAVARSFVMSTGVEERQEISKENGVQDHTLSTSEGKAEDPVKPPAGRDDIFSPRPSFAKKKSRAPVVSTEAPPSFFSSFPSPRMMTYGEDDEEVPEQNGVQDHTPSTSEEKAEEHMTSPSERHAMFSPRPSFTKKEKSTDRSVSSSDNGPLAQQTTTAEFDYWPIAFVGYALFSVYVMHHYHPNVPEEGPTRPCILLGIMGGAVWLLCIQDAMQCRHHNEK